MQTNIKKKQNENWLANLYRFWFVLELLATLYFGCYVWFIMSLLCHCPDIFDWTEKIDYMKLGQDFCIKLLGTCQMGFIRLIFMTPCANSAMDILDIIFTKLKWFDDKIVELEKAKFFTENTGWISIIRLTMTAVHILFFLKAILF